MEIEITQQTRRSALVESCIVGSVYAGVFDHDPVVRLPSRRILLRVKGGMVDLHSGEFFSQWAFKVLYNFHPVRAKLHVTYVGGAHRD